MQVIERVLGRATVGNFDKELAFLAERIVGETGKSVLASADSSLKFQWAFVSLLADVARANERHRDRRSRTPVLGLEDRQAVLQRAYWLDLATAIGGLAATDLPTAEEVVREWIAGGIVPPEFSGNLVYYQDCRAAQRAAV